MAKTRTVRISTDDGSFELPVNPKQISISGDNADKTMELLNLGTIMLPGHRNPCKVSLSPFLPGKNSPFYTGTAPEDIIARLEKAKNGKRAVRIIISGTKINHKFLVNSMSQTYTEGTQDVNATWSFTEDRRESVAAVASLAGIGSTSGLLERPGEPSVPKSVTVKVGDTLWNFAKKYYGDGARWQEIATANQIKDERTLRVGMTLVIPQ